MRQDLSFERPAKSIRTSTRNSSGKWLLPASVASASGLAIVALALTVRGEELGGPAVLTVLTLALLTFALHRAYANAALSTAARVCAGASAFLLLGVGFMLALTALVPGHPVATVDADRAGASSVVPGEAAGRSATLSATGKIAAGASGSVSFGVAIGATAVQGGIERTKGHVRVGRRHGQAQRTTTFRANLIVPDDARELRLTRLTGPLEGRLRISLYRKLAPWWAGPLWAAAALALALILESRFGISAYAVAMGVGLGAITAVFDWADPGAPPEAVALLMVAGGILGGMAAFIVRRSTSAFGRRTG